MTAIPAFVNAAAGTASAARDALDAAGGFDVHEIAPDALHDEIARVVSAGATRIAVAGGDGTIGTAAAVVAGTPTELAILPGGTLNHFARDHGIPTDETAAVIAKEGVVATADVAYVGDRLFLNTSSVGAYVTYVRLRERIERWTGYRIASLLAALRLFFVMRPIAVDMEVNGERKSYSTPIVFIGVGERDTKAPHFGSRVEGGHSCLHVIVVRERRAARLVAVAIEAAARGLAAVNATPDLDSFMVDSCTVRVRANARHVAVDGEIVSLAAPFTYRLAKDALRIIVPRPGTPADE